MPERVRRVGWIFLLMGAGAVTVLALQLQFVILWHAYYSRFPYPGYSYAMEVGAVAPFLMASVRSTQITRFVLSRLSVTTWWFPGRRLAGAGLALWTGVMIAVVGIWVAVPRLREDSNMWPFDLVALSYQTGAPLIVGTLFFRVVRKLVSGWGGDMLLPAEVSCVEAWTVLAGDTCDTCC